LKIQTFSKTIVAYTEGAIWKCRIKGPDGEGPNVTILNSSIEQYQQNKTNDITNCNSIKAKYIIKKRPQILAEHIVSVP